MRVVEAEETTIDVTLLLAPAKEGVSIVERMATGQEIVRMKAEEIDVSTVVVVDI